MSDWVSASVDEFCLSMGIEAVDFTTDSVVQLDFEQRGTLYIECCESELLLCLIRRYREYDVAALSRELLQKMDYRYRRAYVVQAGLRSNDQFALIARIPFEQVTFSAIEQALELLSQLFDNTKINE